MARIDGSFLFTEAERERLKLLCVIPEFLPVLAESLSHVLDAEGEVAVALSSELKKETLGIGREIERRETLLELQDAESVLA